MRCLSTAIFSLLGLFCLAAGLYLLYTVFIDTPDTQAATVGSASQSVSVEAISDIDQESREAQAAQAAELGPTNLQQGNVVFDNQILTSESDVSFQTDAIISTESVSGREGMSANNFDSGQGGSGTVIEQRVVELEWPEQFRTGEGGVVRVSLTTLPDGGLAVTTPEIATNAVLATPINLEDCYDAFDAFVTATIIAPAFDVETADESTKLLTRGSEVDWRWTLTPDKEGTFVFTLALRMDWRLKDNQVAQQGTCSSLAQSEYTFWGQSLQVETVRVLGLITIDQASLAGTVLAVVGAVGQFPFAIEFFGVLLERRIERRAEARRRRRASRRRR